MFTFIDNQLNKVTMYRLTVYALVFMLAVAFMLGALGFMPQNPFAIMFSVAFLLFISDVTNRIFAKIYGATPNTESLYITALILALLISPPNDLADFNYYFLAFCVGVLAMASKYLFAVKKKHILNPAAVAIVIAPIFLGLPATWWVATPKMLPFVSLGGFLLVRKIRRGNLVGSFFVTAIVSILAPTILSGGDVVTAFWRLFAFSPIVFFACIMLTEPLTTPPKQNLRIAYGAIVGLLFAPWVHIGSLYGTPELALLAGNLIFYFLTPNAKLFLTLKEIKVIANDTAEFIFNPGQKLDFLPGQYVEWTLAHENPDSRGNRRCFTIASSPTESDLRFGIKFYDPPSSFKKRLASMKAGDTAIISQITGDFVLPRNKKKKLAFIAGGIGITPFRSIVKYLSDTGEKRDVTLLYGNRTFKDIAYLDIFNEAVQKKGLRAVYALSDTANIPSDWKEEKGNIDAEMIARSIPDYRERYFYVSGSYQMVLSIENALADLGVKKNKMKTDYFPGF